MAACSFGTDEMIAFLVKNGAIVNQKNKVGNMTPLIYTAHNGRFVAVKILLSYGADKNQISDNYLKAIDCVDDNIDVDDNIKEKINKLLQ